MGNDRRKGYKDFACVKCKRGSLVRSNFKFDREGKCWCVKCWRNESTGDNDEAKRSFLET
jgi:hypothetical protein